MTPRPLRKSHPNLLDTQNTWYKKAFKGALSHRTHLRGVNSEAGVSLVSSMVSVFLILDENFCIQWMDLSAQEGICVGTASPFDHEVQIMSNQQKSFQGGAP